jgi:hypothetical protein
MAEERAANGKTMIDEIIHIRMGAFQLAPEFEHLKESPAADFETCAAPPSAPSEGIREAHAAANLLTPNRPRRPFGLLTKFEREVLLAAVGGADKDGQAAAYETLANKFNSTPEAIRLAYFRALRMLRLDLESE